jgi:hypothetical protein
MRQEDNIIYHRTTKTHHGWPLDCGAHEDHALQRVGALPARIILSWRPWIFSNQRTRVCTPRKGATTSSGCSLGIECQKGLLGGIAVAGVRIFAAH